MTKTASTTEPTEQDVRDAEQHAADAGALVEALKQRVRDGDTRVTPAEIGSAADAAEFARLRVDDMARRLEEYRAQVRLTEAEALRDEILASGSNGARLAELASDAVDALAALHTAVVERNSRLQDWRTRMLRLGVPEHNNPLTPPAEHGNLGRSSQYLIAGERRLALLNERDVIGQVVGAFVRERVCPVEVRPGDRSQVLSSLADVDVTPPIDGSLRFFVTTGGGVIEFDREPTDAERVGLAREISRAEAWGA